MYAANYARMQITLSRRALIRYTREVEAVLSLRVFAPHHRRNIIIDPGIVSTKHSRVF